MRNWVAATLPRPVWQTESHEICLKLFAQNAEFMAVAPNYYRKPPTCAQQIHFDRLADMVLLIRILPWQLGSGRQSGRLRLSNLAQFLDTSGLPHSCAILNSNLT